MSSCWGQRPFFFTEEQSSSPGAVVCLPDVGGRGRPHQPRRLRGAVGHVGPSWLSLRRSLKRSVTTRLPSPTLRHASRVPANALRAPQLSVQDRAAEPWGTRGEGPRTGGAGAASPQPPPPPSAPWGPSSRGQSGPRGEPRRSQLEKNFKLQADQAQSRPTRRHRGGRRLSKRRTAAPGSRTTLDADADAEDGRLAARFREPRGRGRHTARVHTLSLPPAAWATSGLRPRVLSGKSRVPIMRLSGPR